MWQAELLNIIAGTLSVGVTPSTNSYESIATTTVGSGGSSTVTFSSIPSGFEHLQIRAIARLSQATTDENALIRFNSDTSSNYNSHYLFGDGNSAAAGGGASSTTMLAFRLTGSSSGANIFGVGVMDILDYDNTNKNKVARTITGHDQNGSGFVFYWSGLWRSTNAITSIDITTTSSSFVEYSQFALYGIKGS